MENLLKKAWQRFVKKLLRYFLVMVISTGMYIGYGVSLLIFGGLGFLLYLFTGKNPFILAFLVSAYAVLAIGALMFVSSWTTLAQVSTVVQDDQKDAFDSFRKTKSLIWKYFGFGLLNSVFFLGLLYTNVLLFIPAILWFFWGLFSNFAFLEGKTGKLTPLWYSKAKVGQAFGKVFIYVAILSLASFMLSGVFSYVDERLSVLNAVLWFFSGLFMMSFNFELYRELPAPKEYKSSKFWIVASVIGWLLVPLIIAGLISTNQFKTNNWEKMFKQNLPKELPIGNGSNIM